MNLQQIKIDKMFGFFFNLWILGEISLKIQWKFHLKRKIKLNLLKISIVSPWQQWINVNNEHLQEANLYRRKLWNFTDENEKSCLLFDVFFCCRKYKILKKKEKKWLVFSNQWKSNVLNPNDFQTFSKISQILILKCCELWHYFHSAGCLYGLCIALLSCWKLPRCTEGVQCNLSWQISCCSSLAHWDVSNKGRNTCFRWLTWSDPTLHQRNPPLLPGFQMSDKANWKISATDQCSSTEQQVLASRLTDFQALLSSQGCIEMVHDAVRIEIFFINYLTSLSLSFSLLQYFLNNFQYIF